MSETIVMRNVSEDVKEKLEEYKDETGLEWAGVARQLVDALVRPDFKTVCNRLQDEMDLTAEQRERIQRILLRKPLPERGTT